MTHLPDCDDYAFSGAGYHPNCERICICRQVRRIEQRVLEEAGDRVAAVFAGTWPGSPAYLLTLRHLRHSVIAAAMNDRTALMRKSNVNT